MIEIKHVTKIYGGTHKAVDDISLTIPTGEIIGFIGPNGAGKTTTIKMITGVLNPDEGEILFKGQPVTFKSPRDAIARGIQMVHQHFMLIPSFTVAQNIVLGSEPKKGVFIDMKSAEYYFLFLERA